MSKVDFKDENSARIIGLPQDQRKDSENGPTRIPEVKDPTPEWQALVLASREIERDYFAELARSRKLEQETAELRRAYLETEKNAGELSSSLENLRAEMAGIQRDLTAMQPELERAEMIKAENRKLCEENERAYQKFLRENRKVQELEAQLEHNAHVRRAKAELETERARYRELTLKLRKEVEYLKTVYPLRDFLRAKEAEVARVKKSLLALPARHPERKNIEAIVRGHIAERDEIRSVVEEAENRLQEQIDAIDELDAALKAEQREGVQQTAPPPPTTAMKSPHLREN